MITNVKVKKAKEKLQQIAKTTAKEVGYELGEIPKVVPDQIFGKDTNSHGGGASGLSESPIIEAMQQATEKTGREPSKKQILKFMKDKGRVDEEVEKYQRKREELQKAWEDSQGQMLGEDYKLEPGQPLYVPTSKPSRGKFHPGKEKSPEKRMGKN